MVDNNMHSVIRAIAKLLHSPQRGGQNDNAQRMDKYEILNEEQQSDNGSTTIDILEGQSLLDHSDADRFNVTPESHYPTATQPIQIGGPGHWHARRITKEKIRLAPYLYMEDGTEIEFEQNEFGEVIPRVPPIARPQSTLRQITNGPGTCRWNAITGSWIDSDRDSSRGSWGQFRDRRRLNRQATCDESESWGLFRTEGLTDASTSTAKSQQERIHFDKPQSQPNQQRYRLDDAEVGRESGAAFVEPLTLKELARLAAENEAAIESYCSPLEGRVIKHVEVR